jgi:PilZ domain
MEIKSRVWERHPVGQPTTCSIQGGETNERWTADIRDVSMAGIGLLFERRFEPGTVLDFAVPETAYGLPAFLAARVVHASALPGGQWLHGCVLLQPLNEVELQRFLGQGKPTSEPAPVPPPVVVPQPAPAPQAAPAARPIPPPAPALNAFVVDQVFASWFGRAQRNG